MAEVTEIDQVAEIAEVVEISDVTNPTENIDVVREFNEEMDLMRKQRRLATVLADSKCLPNVSPVTTFVPPFRTKLELHTLDTLCAHPDYKHKSRYLYQCEQDPFTVRQWRFDKKGNRSTATPKKKEWVEKQGTATDLAQLALKEGAYMATVATLDNKLKNRELLTMEKSMMESQARMMMCTVRREKEANNLREALQEWIEDARILLALANDNSGMFYIVLMIDEDETKEGRKKEKKEEKDVKKEDKKKKNKKNKNKGNIEDKETKKDDEEEVEPESEVISLSFSTRYYGVDYSIKVEMRNDDEVCVKTLPVLKGIDKKITDILAVSTLMDAVIFEFWKAIEA